MARTVKKTAPASKGSKRTYTKRKKANREAVGIALIAAGIFVALSFFTSATGDVGKGFKDVTMGLFGLPAYLLCFIIIGMAIHIIIRKDASAYRLKYFYCGVLVVVISILWHLIIKPDGTDYWEMGQQAGLGGGFFGGIITEVIEEPLGRAGSIITVTALFLTLLIVVFEISLIRIFKFLWNALRDKFAEDDTEDYETDDGEDSVVSGYISSKMKREFKKIKKQVLDFEKDFADFPDKKKVKYEAPTIDMQTEVQVTQEPDAAAITGAIDAQAENTLLPKKKKRDEIEQLEIEVVNERYNYQFPPITLLRAPEKPSALAEDALERTAKKLIETLKSFGVEAKIVDYSRGPTITRYELQPSAGVKISKITNLADDIALNLAATGIRIEPVPGKTAMGIEVPNEFQSNVNVREVIGSVEFSRFQSRLAFALGKDIAGKPIVADIARMPHMLIAGSTGSGKSVCINTLITSILYKAAPHEVKLVLVDPKVVELGVYNGIPHLLIPVVTDPRKAAGALQWAVVEMNNRYKLFADNNVRDLKGYNLQAKENGKEELPQIVIIIDELADLMMVAPGDVEDSICRLAQMARAAGMHLVIATQRPSVDVITGIIKANIPSRIAFAVSSYVDSRTIIDMGGAEKLLGRGDMLYYPMGASKPVRVQGSYVTDKEIERIVAFVKGQNEADYNQDVIEQIESAGERRTVGEDRAGEADELLPQAVELAIEAGQASVAMYQRRLKIGYQRAARLIDQMEKRKIIGGFDGTKPREVLVTRAQWNEMMMNTDFNTIQFDEE
ncbi:MAG: DNA translocase SpoIIIE [Firmicutes bacterium ADurb.Bin193]|nr:MAG: DNA translocase SpoIIIE [Firmicutes bacterium ADurb.Bin193]